MSLRGSKRERVLRVLLNDPEGNLTKYRLAKLSECSREWVIEFLRKLEKEGLVNGTRVLDYAGLIRFWTRIRLTPGHRDYMTRDPLDLLRRTEFRYALTTYQAENLVQRYLFPSRTDLYIPPEEWMKWHEMIVAAGGLVGKGNVRLLFGDNHVFHKAFKRNEFTVVSLPQLIVDLVAEGGICTEAAQLLLEKVSQHAISIS
jgi:hypothetical protein